MPHGEESCSISALADRHPEIRKLDELGVIRRHGNDLGALVTHLRGKVSVRRTRHRQIGASDDDVGRVIPVCGFRHVGLLAPGLRAGGRQVAIPIVKRTAGSADEGKIARTGSIGNHGHGRDRRKTENTIRPPLLDRIYVGSGDNLVDFIPMGAHETAEAAHCGIGFAFLCICLNCRPGIHRILARFSFCAIEVEQTAAYQRMLDTVRAIQIPGERCATLATARLVVGQIVACTRVVGLLHLERDQAVLDENLPAATAGAIDTVSGAHHLVMLPAMAVGIFPLAILIGDDAVTVGKAGLDLVEEFQAIQKVTHGTDSFFDS